MSGQERPSDGSLFWIYSLAVNACAAAATCDLAWRDGKEAVYQNLRDMTTNLIT